MIYVATPISEKPKDDNLHFVLTTNGEDVARYITPLDKRRKGGWENIDGDKIDVINWLKPVDGVIPMTEEQLKELWESAQDRANDLRLGYGLYPDFTEYIKRFKQ